MTLNELMQHPQFSNALQTFYWLQEWGDAHRCDKKRDRLLISDILRGDPRWEHITDNEHIGEVHQDIGYLIAHGFPWFATMCNLPIYVVFDHADMEHNGLYRLASYYCLE